MKRLSILLCSILLCSAAYATMPAKGTYNCKGRDDFYHNVESAKYIVVARLERYLGSGLIN